MKLVPIMFCWNAAAGTMMPIPRFARVAQRQFIDGRGYMLEHRVERSTAAHRSYFASVNEAWKNLPEDMAKEYATAEHLRKRALIKCGFYDASDTEFETAKDAQRAAAIVQSLDEYSVVIVRGNIVRRYVAKSQASHAADKDEFKKQREAVLDLLSSYIGTTRQQLEREGCEPARHVDFDDTAEIQ